MDYRLLFTQRALSDLSEIVEHIVTDDGEVACRFGEALLDHVDLLGRFPRMGNAIRKRSRVRKSFPPWIAQTAEILVQCPGNRWTGPFRRLGGADDHLSTLRWQGYEK